MHGKKQGKGILLVSGMFHYEGELTSCLEHDKLLLALTVCILSSLVWAALVGLPLLKHHFETSRKCLFALRVRCFGHLAY